MTCLIQISTWKRDYLIDPFTTFELIKIHLAKILEDGRILKIFHGGANDIRWLIRDFGIHVVGGIDTQILYQIMKRDGQMDLIGFKAAVEEFLEHTIDKTYQNADWRQRPLTAQMKKYAREDSHLVLRLFDQMRKQVS